MHGIILPVHGADGEDHLPEFFYRAKMDTVHARPADHRGTAGRAKIVASPVSAHKAQRLGIDGELLKIFIIQCVSSVTNIFPHRIPKESGRGPRARSIRPPP